MRHKEAQDAIVRAGNSFEITIQRGGGTWKPQVKPVGGMPKPQMTNNIAPAPVTKTSLASTVPAPAPIGGGYNNAAKPFGAPQMNGTSNNTVKSIVNKQYNTPVGMYSEENIAETLSAQAEVLAGGVLGVNFKKNERTYQPNNSEVLRMVQEGDLEPRDQHTEPEDPAFAASTGLRRVPAPISAPTTPVAPAPAPSAAPAAPKTQLPPGQNICSECERLIVGVFVRIKDKNLHVECFKCATCGSSLKNVGYYNIGTKLYCDVHAKMAARQNPPGPNLEPVTVPPGQRPPVSAISAAIAAAGAPSMQSPAPVASVSSPSAASANMAPLPFHAPRRGTSHVSAPRTFVQQPTPPSSAPAAPAPKPFFAPPPPTVSSAAMNKPAGGSKFVWPPKRPEDENPMITGPTATPIYINPMEPTPLERGPPPAPAADQGRQITITPVKAPRPITPTAVERGPPVHPPLSVPVLPERPCSPMVFALTTAPTQPYNLGVSCSTSIQSQHKQTTLISQQHTQQIQTYQTSFDAPPQPYSQPQWQAPKPIHSVQAPKSSAPAAPKPVVPAPTFAPVPTFAPAPAPAPVQPVAQKPIPIPVQQHAPRPTSPLPPLQSIPAKQTFPPPAPLLTQAPKSPAAVTAPAPAPGPGAFGSAPGGGGGPRGASFAGASAPKRGRGVLTAPVTGGGRGVPICGMCQGQIRGPFITAMGKTWCPEHFICVNSQCQRQLQDIGFVEEKGDLYCEFCFEKFLAPSCEKCRNKIKGDCLNAIGKHFHPECFVCSYCGKLFGNNPFFLEDGLPYCENDWNELFTTKCFACGFPIEAGDRWVEALNNNYHSQCFNCTMCKKNLEGQSFFAKQGRPFCKTHAR
ncbi:hypothetical protein B566_EDAN009436 [Ephemera danica]|nr:hypothetical protein B566_EDAN009436 [Ephemera danica]